MTTTTIRVSQKVHRQLNTLARSEGVSMQQVLEAALEHYRRRQFLLAVNDAYAALRNDPAAQAEETAEQALWDNTLPDGLEAW